MGPRPAADASWITGLVLFALVLAVPGVLADADTLWQIATGKLILRDHAIPHTDPFSYSVAGQRWFAHEWLSEVLLALADQAGGPRGVMTLTALCAGATAGLLLWHLRWFMALIPAVVVMLQAMANCMGSLLARPHVLAWPCLELWCAGLVLARGRERAPSFWLLPVMAIWVNLHGSFMVGLLLPFAFLLEAAVSAGPNWRAPAKAWAGFIAAAWAVALLNPEVWRGVLFPIQLLGMRNIGWVGEWTQADFSAVRPLDLLLLLLLGCGLLGRMTVPPFRLLMLLGLVHLALHHWRHAQLLGLIGALLLAEAIGRLAPPLPSPPLKSPRALTGGIAACAALALFVRFTIPLDNPPGAAALAALDKIPAALRARPVLNDYGFGAYLIAHGDRPFVDSRADMYGDAFLDRFRAIVDLKPGALTAALAEYQVAWTVFAPDSPVVLVLDHEPGWRRLMSDPAAVVHVRTDALAER